MEDERYQYRKQHDPDFLGSGASASIPSSSEGGRTNENAEDEEFDEALEKRRNDRKKKKTEQHFKLDRLVESDVAAPALSASRGPGSSGRKLLRRPQTKLSSRVLSGKCQRNDPRRKAKMPMNRSHARVRGTQSSPRRSGAIKIG